MRPLSRTIWVVGIGGLAFLVVLAVFVLKTKSSTSPISSGVTVAESESFQQVFTEQFKDQDGDGDGLRDWEETLWGTDPHNPDTDGDKTPDGEEVDQDRNPTIAGPDDALSIPQGSGEFSAVSNTEDMSTTDQFSQEFFAKYIDLRQSGQLENQAVLTYTLNSVIEDALDKTIPESYTKAHIKTSSDISDGALHSYGNAIGAILLQHTVINLDSAEILLDVLDKGNEERLEELRYNAAAYKAIANDLSNITVPQNAATTHLALTNGIASLGNTIEDMSLIYDDPLRSVVAIGRYQNIAHNLQPALQGIVSYFNTNNIRFEETEPGYAIVNIL